MAVLFEHHFQAGWGAMDFNGHMANRAYLDMASDTRMLFFKEYGFAMNDFARLGIGPVVRKDTIEYYREIRLMETVRVELCTAGLSPLGSRMKMRNIFYRENGEKAAVLTSDAGWLNLHERHLMMPPLELRDLLHSLQHSDDYEELEDIRA